MILTVSHVTLCVCTTTAQMTARSKFAGHPMTVIVAKKRGATGPQSVVASQDSQTAPAKRSVRYGYCDRIVEGLNFLTWEKC